MDIRSAVNTWNHQPVHSRGKRLSQICASTLQVIILFLGVPIAAQSSAQQQEGQAQREVVDETGKTVHVPLESKRIVSLAPNLTEIVFALGDGDHLIGDTDFCDYPLEATRKTHVGGPVNPNLEQIVALNPDLVLATSINRRETVRALDHLGLPVYVTDPHSIEEMMMSVENLGDALGIEKSADVVANEMRNRLSGLDSRLSGVAPRRVLFVVWLDPLMSIGRNTFVADAVRRAGGRSVVETDTEWPHLNLEEVVRLQPEYLVFASSHSQEEQPDVDALRMLPGWRELEAVRRGKIVVVSDAIKRPAPRIIGAVEQLARALHPEAFAPQNVAAAKLDAAGPEACACAR